MKQLTTAFLSLVTGLALGFTAPLGNASVIAKATAESDSPSYVYDAQESSTSASASAESDAANYAHAKADVTAGTVGIDAATNSTSYTTQLAEASILDFWSCPGCIFVRLPPVGIKIGIHGVLSSAFFAPPLQYDSPFFSGTISFFGDTVYLNYDSNTQQLTEEYCPAGTPCFASVALPYTTLPDGSHSYSTSLNFIGYAGGTGFDSTLDLQGGWDPVEQPYSIDFLNTISLDVISYSGDVWTSEAGRKSIAGVLGSIPEPATLSLVGLSLVALAASRRSPS